MVQTGKDESRFRPPNLTLEAYHGFMRGEGGVTVLKNDSLQEPTEFALDSTLRSSISE